MYMYDPDEEDTDTLDYSLADDGDIDWEEVEAGDEY